MLTRSQTRGVPGAVSTSRYVTVAQITRDNIIGHSNPAKANTTNHSTDSLQGAANTDISRDAAGEDITTPPVRKEKRGRKPWKKALAEASNMEQSQIEAASASTAPIQSTEVMYVVPKKRGPGRPRKKPILEPVIVEQRVLPPQETNDHEEVSASSDTGTNIARRSPKRRRETSVSSKSDNNDDIAGLKRRTIKKKQAVKVPWYRRRRLLPIEALPAEDQRTLAMFDFNSDVSAEELEGLYQKAYKYMKDLKVEYRNLKAQERKLTKQINARIRENSTAMIRASPDPISPLRETGFD